MFSLVITILAIALVAILAYAALYYGSSAANDAGARARAVTLVNQGEQIVGATQIFYVENSRAPATLQELVDLGYLSKLPVPTGTKLAASSFSLISSAIAAEPDRWTWDPTTRTLALVKAVEPTSVCAQVNNVTFKVAEVKNAVDPSLRVQCYGASSAEGYTVIWNANVPTDTKVSTGQYALCEGTKAVGHVPAECNVGVVTTGSTSGGATGSTSGTGDPVAELVLSFIGSPTLPAAEVNFPYSYDLMQSLSVTGGGAYTPSDVSWSLSSGTLPPGLTLAANGILSGKPTAKNTGGASFEIKASYKGKDGKQVYTIVVNGETLRVTQISTGGAHTCVVTTSQAAKCWGYNGNGQLGNGTTTNSSKPVTVSGLSTGAVKIFAGNLHTCAIVGSMYVHTSVRCWGNNYFGQLGNGTTTNSLIPVTVGLSSSDMTGRGSNYTYNATMALGGYHTCLLGGDGSLKCWGANDFGSVGNSNSGVTNITYPEDVTSMASGVTSVTAGQSHTCAVVNGAAKCWGNGAYGQLGNGTTTAKNLSPKQVPGLESGVASVAADGFQSCALTTAGTVKCWGANSAGQLGNNSTTNSLVPVDVVGLSGATSLSLGENYACVTSASGPQCWGSNNNGQFGNGTTNNSLVPTPMTLPANTAEFFTGGSFACARLTDGHIQCWGANSVGQLGNGTMTTNSLVPVDVTL